MKKSGKCPKCGSKELIKVPGDTMPANAGRFIMTGLTNLSSVVFDRYVCSQCGYSEEYFDYDGIAKLSKKFGVENN